MIRINLLPEAKKQISAGAGTQIWAVIYLLSVIVWCIFLGVIYWRFEGDLQEQQAANRSLEQEIEQVSRQKTDLDEVMAKLEKSRQLEEVISKLEAARQGPTRLLMELSKILSLGGGPTIDEKRLERLRQQNPLAGFNPGWDFRRLWISSFEELERECTITGTGKTNEDVAEFLRRLSLSDVFEKVTLQETTSMEGEKDKLPVVGFSVVSEVRY